MSLIDIVLRAFKGNKDNIIKRDQIVDIIQHCTNQLALQGFNVDLDVDDYNHRIIARFFNPDYPQPKPEDYANYEDYEDAEAGPDTNEITLTFMANEDGEFYFMDLDKNYYNEDNHYIRGEARYKFDEDGNPTYMRDLGNEEIRTYHDLDVEIIRAAMFAFRDDMPTHLDEFSERKKMDQISVSI